MSKERLFFSSSRMLAFELRRLLLGESMTTAPLPGLSSTAEPAE